MEPNYSAAMNLSSIGWLERRWIQRASLCGPYFYYRYRDAKGKLQALYYGKQDPLQSKDAPLWREFHGFADWDDKPVPNKAGSIYLISFPSTPQYYKIGISTTPEARLATLQCGLPFDLELLHTFDADNAQEAENALHAIFSDKRARGEWFLLDEDDVSWLRCITGYDDGTFHANS